jgi:hypothetical protein
MKRLACVLACWGITAAAQSDSEDALWFAYYDCIEQNIEDVAFLIESLEEGAKIIFESLCQRTAGDLLNAVANRPIFNESDLNARYANARYVIERETRLLIFRERVRSQ